MNLIEWRDEFCIGIPAVDHEHRELIELINKLLVQIMNSTSHSTALEYLGDIHAMISSHFALEEKIMRDCHYDEYWDHKADHDRLLDDIRDLMDEYEDNIDLDTESFSDRLSDWFTEHFNSKDARLHKHLDHV